MKKITALTDAQKARFPEWAEKWTRIGLCTDPANRPMAEDGLRTCYRFAKLNSEVPIIWVSSPLVGALAAPLASIIIASKLGDSAVYSAVDSAVRSAVDSAVRSAVDSAVRSAVRSAVDSAVRSAVCSAVDSAVRSAVCSAVDSAVYSAVDSAVCSAVRSTVYSAVHSAVYSAVGSAVGSAVDSAVCSTVYSAVHSAVYSAVGSAVGSAVDSRKIFWHDWYGGSLWSAWPAVISFFGDVCDLKLSVWPQFEAYKKTVLHAGYWWPNRDFIVVSERPRSIKRNAQGLLHNDGGMSIQYPDGWGLWSIDGISVDEQIVLRPETQTVEQIDKEQNQDVRSIRINRFGWPRYLKECGAKNIDARHNDIEGTEEALYVLPNGETKLVASCPTGRPFVMGVGDKPNQIKTCEQAQRWIHRDRVMLART